MNDRLLWPGVIVVSALSMDLHVFAGTHGAVRLLVTLWFLLVCTGMSFVPLLGVRSPAIELLLGLLASIVLDAIVATTIVLIGGLSAASGLFVLETICGAGCTAQLRRPSPQAARSRL